MKPIRSNNICPLIGNGINQLTNSKISWEEIIHRLGKKLKLPNISENIHSRPFTFIYDESRLVAKRQSKNSKTGIKDFIAQEISKLSHSKYHSSLAAIGFRHILTTNYDYTLEQAYNKSDGERLKPLSTKYNLFTRRICGDTNVWHIHGEVDKPRSIVMGYDQYAGTLQRMRQYLKTNYLGHHSPFKERRLDFDSNDRDSVYSWIDLFLRDDIHIVGLTLDYTEIDLWWILYEKARQRNKGNTNAKTYYYHFDNGKATPEILGRLNSLKALDVSIKPISISDGYPAAWDKILRKFERFV
jgi:hypothetical protein